MDKISIHLDSRYIRIFAQTRRDGFTVNIFRHHLWYRGVEFKAKPMEYLGYDACLSGISDRLATIKKVLHFDK